MFEKCQRAPVADQNISKNAPGQKLSPPRVLTFFGSKFDKTLLRWCLTNIRMGFWISFLVFEIFALKLRTFVKHHLKSVLSNFEPKKRV